MKYLVLLLVLASCAKKGTPEVVNGARDDFEVTFLFEKDACKVYRFADNGRYHYFTNCTEVVSTYCERQGKTCIDKSDNVRKGP